MIAGIDFSTKAVDVVLLEEESDRATWHRFELSGQDAFDRARSLRAAMPGSSFWDAVVACGIEQPQMRGSSMAAAYSLYRVQGAVLACLPAQMLVQPLHPSEWRKTVGLPGNAKKDEVAWFAHKRHRTHGAGTLDWPQDACDAYCIALATRTMLHATEQAA